VNEALCNTIREAFAGVTLGRGVGLQEAQGIDDYEDADTCSRYRATDQKEDWSCIPVSVLNRCNSSLSFFDAEGIRFHLPAYLISSLRGEYSFGMAHCLACTFVTSPDKFRLLSTEQRRAVRLFLLHILNDRE